MNKKVQAGAALFVLAIIIAVGALISRPKSTNTSSGAGDCAITASTAFKDGSYTATGSYDSPGGQESLKVTIKIANSVVSDAAVVSGANDPTASEYQSQFISGYKSMVVGKKITGITLSNVAGSSLTSQGFNEALQSIECQARQS